MKHEFKKIKVVKVVSEGVLELEFNCGSHRRIDLNPIMHGSLFGSLKDPKVFKEVKIDHEVGTIYWPNGADFDPDTLFHWDEVVGDISAHLKSA